MRDIFLWMAAAVVPRVEAQGADYFKLNLGLSQITDFWGYHGTYAQEPAQQI